MLTYARQTLKRVPSFQELLHGAMGSAKEEMYVHLPHRPATPPRLTLRSSVDVLVIGAGPTGLGAAKRLHQIVRSVTSPKYCKTKANIRRTAPHG
jgi:NADH dehydrogenase FAD-containing subunit